MFKKAQSVLLTYSWRETIWMHTFPYVTFVLQHNLFSSTVSFFLERKVAPQLADFIARL